MIIERTSVKRHRIKIYTETHSPDGIVVRRFLTIIPSPMCITVKFIGVFRMEGGHIEKVVKNVWTNG